MNQNRKLVLHYLILLCLLTLGAILRFWHLDYKPLWLDEVITALFSLGHSYYDIPLNMVFSTSILTNIFSFNPEVSCADIANNIITQSTHPPLFFCLMHSWINWLGYRHNLSLDSLAWILRSLSVVFGIASIVAIYFLNRIAFSMSAGLMAAALMTVSPFGVYLSQEARHYTLPILLITLALINLILIQRAFSKNEQPRLFIWLIWTMVNVIGFYTHYFFIIAFIAQILTQILMFIKNHSYKEKDYFFYFQPFTFSLIPVCLFIPWVFVLINHFRGAETNWMPPPHNIAPLYQSIVAWLLMAIALPVESQPLWIAIPLGFLMICFGLWVGWQVLPILKQICRNKTTHSEVFTLGIFTFWVMLEFLGIIYVFHKDITIAPRYHFVYYPAICALLGVIILKKDSKTKTNYLAYIVLLIGLTSCIFVTADLAFKKSHNPQVFVNNTNLDVNIPMIVVMGYNNDQDMALGLSFALQLDKVRHKNIDNYSLSFNSQENTYFAFIKMSSNDDWQKISKMKFPQISHFNLWVLASINYPKQLTFPINRICAIDSSHYHYLGIPYQLYRC